MQDSCTTSELIPHYLIGINCLQTVADSEVSQALGYAHYACECTYIYPWKPLGAKGDLLGWT